MTGNVQSGGETAALMTYSSVLLPGAVEPTPSGLSVLAAVGAAQIFSDCPPEKLLIAGEQSYAHTVATTGDLLASAYGELLADTRPHVLRSEENRLLNTPLQVEALTAHCQDYGLSELHVIGWAFHARRVLRLFKAFNPKLDVRYSEVDQVLLKMDHKALQPYLDTLGIMVGMEEILKRGIKQFSRREWLTRQALWFGPRGQVINVLSRARGVGRFDDLRSDGSALWSTTRLTSEQVATISSTLVLPDSDDPRSPAVID